MADERLVVLNRCDNLGFGFSLLGEAGLPHIIYEIEENSPAARSGEIWKSKELHGRFYKALTGPDVDQITSVAWLQFGDLFGETEGFVCAIMDKVIKTRNYQKHIMKDGTLDICRACHLPGESLRHIVIVDQSVPRAIIVDITIPHDDNLVKADKEKVTKYLDLAHEITAMWNVESTIFVPIVVSVNGLIEKSFDQQLKKLLLDCWIKGWIQKAVVLETARIVVPHSGALTARCLSIQMP